MNNQVEVDGYRFWYEDAGGPGTPVVALHGAFGRGATFAALAEELQPEYRLIAPDLRGHGMTRPVPGAVERVTGFGRDAFVADVAGFVEALGLDPALVIGHSLGGVTAYQLAARRPELVRALVIEDTGAVTDETELPQPIVDITHWPRWFADRAELVRFFESLGMPAIDYFLESATQEDGRWRLRFDYEDLMAVQRGNVGNWWADWSSVSHPTLLLRATDSFLLSARMADDMQARRPSIQLAVFENTGHWIHRTAPREYAATVREFFTTVLRP